MPVTGNKVTAGQAKAILVLSPARENFVFVGPPGVGKSQIVEQAAEAVGAELFVLLGSSMAPEDVSGIPMPDDKDHPRAMRMLPFAVLAECTEPDGPPRWIFLDEFTAADITVQKAFMNLFETRIVPNSGRRLRDNVRLILACNRKEDGAYTHPMPLPVRAGRVRFWELAPDFAEWVRWHEAKYPQYPEVRDFLATGEHRRFWNPSLKQYAQGAKRDELSGVPCPRSWEKVSIAQTWLPPGDDGTLAVLVHATLGGDPDAASSFLQWRRQRTRLPDPRLVMAPATVGQALDALALKGPDGQPLMAHPLGGEPITQFDPGLSVAYGNRVLEFLAELRHTRGLEDAEIQGLFVFLAALRARLPDLARDLIDRARREDAPLFAASPVLQALVMTVTAPAAQGGRR